MSTDLENRLNAALVGALDTDAGVVALTGRASGNLLPMSDIGAAQLPALMYLLLDLTPNGAAGDTRLATYQITAIADGDGAQSMTAALLQRVELAVTEPALRAQGIDACPSGRPHRRRVPIDSDATRALARADLDFILRVTA